MYNIYRNGTQDQKRLIKSFFALPLLKPSEVNSAIAEIEIIINNIENDNDFKVKVCYIMYLKVFFIVYTSRHTCQDKIF